MSTSTRRPSRRARRTSSWSLPDDTFLIQNPIAATTAGGAKGKAFVKFALGDSAQQHFADWGYRPVNEAVLAKQQGQVPGPGLAEDRR